jgi:hypothetical protein
MRKKSSGGNGRESNGHGAGRKGKSRLSATFFRFFAKVKESLFLKSFSAGRKVWLAMLLDFVNYAIMAGLAVLYFITTEKGFDTLNQLKGSGGLTLEATSAAADVLHGLKIYAAVVLFLMAASWAFWRFYILAKYFSWRKERWWKYVAYPAMLAAVKAVIAVAFFCLMLFSYLAFRQVIAEIVIFLLALLFLHAYVSASYGIASSPSVEKAFRNSWRLFRSFWSIVVPLLISYVFFLALALAVLSAAEFNEIAYLVSLPLLAFVFLNWARNYFYLAASRILGMEG